MRPPNKSKTLELLGHELYSLLTHPHLQYDIAVVSPIECYADMRNVTQQLKWLIQAGGQEHRLYRLVESPSTRAVSEFHMVRGVTLDIYAHVIERVKTAVRKNRLYDPYGVDNHPDTRPRYTTTCTI